MAKAAKTKEFYLFDKHGVYLGPVEAETCPENATDKKPPLVGETDRSPVLIGGEWKVISHADIIKATEVRTLRDSLLSGSDYTQLADAQVDAKAWAEYRAALRDVPTQKGFPQAVEWPAKPQAKKVEEPKK